MQIPTLEHRFKQFWDYIYNSVVNLKFRNAKEVLHDMGFIYQLSVYGAVREGDKIKGVRIEILHNKKLTKRMLYRIKQNLIIPPIGYNLCVYFRNQLEIVLSEFEIRRRLIR